MWNNRRWFTLIEILIVLVISWLLMSVLFKAYTQISQLTVKVENEKTVATESLFLNQFFQSLVNGNTLDYSLYTGKDAISLYTDGTTQTIGFIGEKSMRISSTGDCILFSWDTTTFAHVTKGKMCRIQGIFKNGKTIDLTDKTKVYVSNISFKILPQQRYTGNALLYFTEEDYRQSQSFWLLGYIRIRGFSPAWTTNAMLPLQVFYHIE